MAKCHLVVVGSDEVDAVRGWLVVAWPRWADCKVSRAARYLGMVLGPDAGSSSFDAPVGRFAGTIRQIKLAQLGFLRNVVAYN
eukprot:3272484-Lingulodinium_polyedra.AAC.1